MIDRLQEASPFEKLYRKQLPEDDVAEMRANLVGFFDVLVEIERESKAENGHATDRH